MSKLTLLTFPDPNLRKIAKPVSEFDESLENLVNQMFETMYAENGIGLAATQVNIQKCVIVIDLGKKDDSTVTDITDKETDDSTPKQPDPITLINPVIIKESEEKITYQEGCLSVPEIYADILRAKHITIEAFDVKGKKISMECDGLLSVCVQHEIDHLKGKLFVDYLSLTKRNLIRDKLKKIKKK